MDKSSTLEPAPLYKSSRAAGDRRAPRRATIEKLRQLARASFPAPVGPVLVLNCAPAHPLSEKCI
ncbi:MAG: hypothetical protein K2L28_05510, partial [Muribaculaceae bacterium]|nr:hypothetical protein [Muribaculaceae bacterium]